LNFIRTALKMSMLGALGFLLLTRAGLIPVRTVSNAGSQSAQRNPGSAQAINQISQDSVTAPVNSTTDSNWTPRSENLVEYTKLTSNIKGSISNGSMIPALVGSQGISSTHSPNDLIYDEVGIRFSGQGGAINFGSPQWSQGIEPRSICVWANTNSISSPGSIIASFGSSVGKNSLFIGRAGASLLASVGGGASEIEVKDFWTPGVWDQICLSYDGKVARLYANGANFFSQAQPSRFMPGTLWVGQQQDGSSPWNGNIAEMALWRGDLNTENIETIYAAQSSAYALATSASPSPIAKNSSPASIKKWSSVADRMMREATPRKVIAIGIAAGLAPKFTEGKNVSSAEYSLAMVDPSSRQLVFNMGVHSDIFLKTPQGVGSPDPSLVSDEYLDTSRNVSNDVYSILNKGSQILNQMNAKRTGVWDWGSSYFCDVASSAMYAGINSGHYPYISSILQPGQKNVWVVTDSSTQNANFNARFLVGNALSGALQDLNQDLNAVPLTFGFLPGNAGEIDAELLDVSTSPNPSATTAPIVVSCGDMGKNVWGDTLPKTDYTKSPPKSFAQITLGCDSFSGTSAYDRSALRHEIYHALGFAHSASKTVMNYAYGTNNKFQSLTWLVPSNPSSPSRQTYLAQWQGTNNSSDSSGGSPRQTLACDWPSGQFLSPNNINDSSAKSPDVFYDDGLNHQTRPYMPPPPNAVQALQEIVSTTQTFQIDFSSCLQSAAYEAGQMAELTVKEFGVYSCDWKDNPYVISSELPQLNSYYQTLHGVPAGPSSPSNPGVGSICTGFGSSTDSSTPQATAPMPAFLANSCSASPSPSSSSGVSDSALLGLNDPSSPNQNSLGGLPQNNNGMNNTARGAQNINPAGGANQPGQNIGTQAPATNGLDQTPQSQVLAGGSLGQGQATGGDPSSATGSSSNFNGAALGSQDISAGGQGANSGTNTLNSPNNPPDGATTTDPNSAQAQQANGSGNGGTQGVNCATGMMIAQGAGKNGGQYSCSGTQALIQNSNTAITQGQNSGASSINSMGQAAQQQVSNNGMSQAAILQAASKLSGQAGSMQTSLGAVQLANGLLENGAANQHQRNANQFTQASSQNNYPINQTGPSGQSTVTATEGANSMSMGALVTVPTQGGVYTDNSVIMNNLKAAQVAAQAASQNSATARNQQKTMSSKARNAAYQDLLKGVSTMSQGMRAQQASQSDTNTEKSLNASNGEAFSSQGITQQGSVGANQEVATTPASEQIINLSAQEEPINNTRPTQNMRAADTSGTEAAPSGINVSAPNIQSAQPYGAAVQMENSETAPTQNQPSAVVDGMPADLRARYEREFGRVPASVEPSPSPSPSLQ
jgi:hypothetical protein